MRAALDPALVDLVLSNAPMDPKLLEILVCPVTKGPLVYDRERQELVSKSARLAYPIRDGIPVMLEDEARQAHARGVRRARSAALAPMFTVLIPARYASTRLPGKPLADIAGKPMVVRVAERAQKSGAARVVVATDDERDARRRRARTASTRCSRAPTIRPAPTGWPKPPRARRSPTTRSS